MIALSEGLQNPKAYWDSQLKFSSILPKFQTYLERMEAESRAFSEGRRFHKHATGPDPRQWVEWTEGTGAGRVIPVLIHGGYWRALRAEDHRFTMAPLLDAAPAVGSIEYRLKPACPMGDIVEDARNGLRAMAQTFPSADFVLIGHSAGAHLALWASQDPSLRARVVGVVAVSGVYDLHPVAASSLQSEIQLTPEEITTYSLEPAESFPPTVYVNGADETHELIRGSMKMATLGASKVVLLPDANHMTLAWSVADWLKDMADQEQLWDHLFER